MKPDKILSKLLTMNMIDQGNVNNRGDNIMTWYSPNREYTLIIKRSDRKIFTDRSNYTVMINIYNNIGLLLDTIQCNEYDIINLLNRVTNLFESADYVIDEIPIGFDTRLNTTVLSLDTILNSDGVSNELISTGYNSTNNPIVSTYYDDSTGEIRDIKLSIFNVDGYGNKIIKMITYISPSELYDFCFNIYFEVLIDIVPNSVYESDMEYFYNQFMSL